MSSASIKADRRQNSYNTQEEFFDAIEEHIRQEDVRLVEGAKRMEMIENDLKPIKNMYWAIIGSAGIGSLLLGLLIYIYAVDKNDFKDLQRAIITQGEAIKGLMVSQSNLESSYRRDMERMERGQDRLYNQNDRREAAR